MQRIITNTNYRKLLRINFLAVRPRVSYERTSDPGEVRAKFKNKHSREEKSKRTVKNVCFGNDEHHMRQTHPQKMTTEHRLQ